MSIFATKFSKNDRTQRIVTTFFLWHEYLEVYELVRFSLASKKALALLSSQLTALNLSKFKWKDETLYQRGSDFHSALQFFEHHHVLSRVRQVRLLNTSYLLPDIFDLILLKFNYLTYLRISKIELEYRDSDALRLLLFKVAKTLRTFHVDSSILKTLDLSMCASLTSLQLPHAFSLQRLQINPACKLADFNIGHSRISGKDLLALLQPHLNSLQRVSITYSACITGDFVFPRMPALQHLNISQCTRIRSIEMQAPHLAYLNVQHCYVLQSITFAEPSPNLLELDLRMLQKFVHLNNAPVTCTVLDEGSQLMDLDMNIATN